MILLEDTRVASHAAVRGGYRLLTLRAPRIAARVRPGQFVHLRVPNLADALLRRPFSVFRAEAGRLALLYKPVGRGTRAMEALRPGETVNLLGPLGYGFPPVSRRRFPILVAGGYGAAALYLLAQRAPVKGLVLIGGARAADLLCAREFRALGWAVRAATEDGSAGTRGLVTDLLDRWLERERRGRVPELFACGPNGMLRAVCARALAGGWRGWVSVDRHMGCGLGACLACVQKVRARDDAGRATWTWARVCTEGPVFACRDVVWD